MPDTLVPRLEMLKLLFPDRLRQEQIGGLIESTEALLHDREQLVFELGRVYHTLTDMLDCDTSRRVFTDDGRRWFEEFVQERRTQVSQLLESDEWAMVHPRV